MQPYHYPYAHQALKATRQTLKARRQLLLRCMHLYIATALSLQFAGAQINTSPAKYDALLTVQADQPVHPVSPTLYGAFFEEISHGGDGGLYAEMIQNRGFEDSQLPPGCLYVDGFLVPKRTPHFGMAAGGISDWKLPYENKGDFPGWQLHQPAGTKMQVSLTDIHPLSAASPHSLKILIQEPGASEAAFPGIINQGYHGISLKAGAAYTLSFYVYTGDGDGDGQASYTGAIIAELYTRDHQRVISQAVPIRQNRRDRWQKYTCTFKAGKDIDSGYLQLSFDHKGSLLLDFVSMFPQQTFRNQPGGLRLDLASKIAALHPAFLRWPGGCYVEGMNIESAFDWKNTIGPVINRPQTFSPWGYWSTNGFGYDEYLRFCEQIGAKGLFVANVGVSCEMRSGTFIPDDSLQPYIQNALDAIEYATGPVSSAWGSLRAKNGHPPPYPLQYIELGNEQSGPRYARRYNRFYAAIHNKYPGLQIIASMGLGDINHYTTDSMQHLDIADEHAYKALNWSMANYTHFDHYPRKNYRIYVGEFATNSGVGKGNMGAALSDAVYMMGMEKNGDLVTMSSYAPLLADVHDDNWPVNLINFNNRTSFARISYYALQLFEQNRPNRNLAGQLTLKHNRARQKARFGGTIGFATWDTQTAYKDLKITKDGKTLYQSDFINKDHQWRLLRGSWTFSDSSIAETAEGPQTLAYLKDHHFDTYTLEVKARKISGTNAFIIPFGITDSNTFYRAHIGSWVNSHATIEKVTHGYEVADLITQRPLPAAIKTGKWYDIKLQVMEDSVACYLDGKLIMTYQEPEKLFALAGIDTTDGKKDMIIKMVNAYPEEKNLQVSLEGLKKTFGRPLDKTADWLILSAPSLRAENSLSAPMKYVPKRQKLTIPDTTFSIRVPAYSISVLRLGEKK